MSTFKVNYAGLRKPQKINESPSAHSTSAATSNQQTSRTQAQMTPSDSQSNSATKKEENSALLSLYQGSFQSENLDYINLLLKNKASSNKEKNQGGLRKKGHIRTKSTFVESRQSQLQVESPELSEKAKIEPVYKKMEENDKPASMRPDNDDGFMAREQDKRKGEMSVDREQDEEEFYDGNDTHRNLNNTPTKNEGKLFDRFFKDDGVVRRSMSMEDLRIDKKALKKNPNKSTLHNAAELRYYSIEKSPEGSTHQDSKQSNGSFRTDFLTSLNSYLDYFHKSENISYRNMKAGQYFRGNNGKSHRSMQKELEASNQELRALKMQVHDLKWKVNDLTAGSKMLTKELKIANTRNEEYQQLFQKMQAEILHLKQKNRHYKSQCIQLQEAYKRERSESESNLLALRQVLANINVALEHKSTPFLGNTLITDKPVSVKGLGNIILSTKNKDKALKSHMKENRLNGASEVYGSFFEMPSNYKRARDLKETPKKGGSIIFSPKISITSNEEEEGFSYPEMNSMGYEGNYEGEGSQFQDPYNETYQHEDNIKDQQIKFLQDKLAELMLNEEVSFNKQNSHQKSTTKSSREKQFNNKKKPSIAVTPTSNYYVTRDRQGSLSKLSNLSAKYDPREQRSGLIRHDYEEPPSLNDESERSFSMHHSD